MPEEAFRNQKDNAAPDDRLHVVGAAPDYRRSKGGQVDQGMGTASAVAGCTVKRFFLYVLAFRRLGFSELISLVVFLVRFGFSAGGFF